MIKSHKDLSVYQQAFTLSLEIHELSDTFPEHEKYALSVQMRRTSRAICAPIAEGFAKQKASFDGFKQSILDAIGGAAEMTVWLDYAFEYKYIDKKSYQKAYQEYEKIAGLLRGLHLKINEQESHFKAREMSANESSANVA